MKFDKKVRVIAPVMIGIAALSSGIIHRAAADSKPPQLIATVDLLKVQSPDGGWARWSSELNRVQAERQQYADIMAEFTGGQSTQNDAAIAPVDTETLKAWIALKEKSVLHPDDMSPAEKSTLAEYESKANTATAHLASLEQKPTPTPSEKDELQKLEALRQGAAQTLTAQATDYGKKFNNDVDAASKALKTQVDDAVRKVAEANGITYVLNGTFISQMGGPQRSILYSADDNIDITDKVIKRLNQSR